MDNELIAIAIDKYLRDQYNPHLIAKIVNKEIIADSTCKCKIKQ